VSVYRRANLGKLFPPGSRPNTWKNLVEDLAHVLKKVEPEIVVTAHPLLDTHADHQFTTVALHEALQRSKQDATFLLYTNHASENLYPFGPAGTAMSIPPWSGPELPVQGVYSHPVGPELQRRKLYALESMHDLRLSPTEQSTCADTGAPRRADYPRVYAVDYLRRGPRAEETFFVYDRQGLQQVVQSFLAQAGARP
jgi:LmbE family N-acetylglucosaminyl deacetylase